MPRSQNLTAFFDILQVLYSSYSIFQGILLALEEGAIDEILYFFVLQMFLVYSYTWKKTHNIKFWKLKKVSLDKYTRNNEVWRPT